MKLASTSAVIMYNSIESGHFWRIPRIRVKGSDRRPFILILDWSLVRTQLSSCEWICLYIWNFANQKRQNPNQLHQRFLFSLFDTSIMPQIVKRVCKIVLSFNSSRLVFTYYCILCIFRWFLRIVVYGSVDFNIFFISCFIYDRHDSCSESNNHSARLSSGFINV